MNKNKKTIFITGATSGFGWATAEIFAQEGYRLVLCGRRKERLVELNKILAGAEIYIGELDVRNAQEVELFINNLPDNFKNIDILVNNAGLALGLESFVNLPRDNIERMIDTNIKGVMYCTQAVLPGMIARKFGHIINLSSIAASYPYPGGNVYGATKAFLTQWSLNLRADILGHPIRVTSIEPGMAETEFSKVRFKGDEKKASDVYKGMQPLTAEDIARTILWCVQQPLHVNINRVELMPIMQAFSPFAVYRDDAF